MNAVIQDILVYLVYLMIVIIVAEGPKSINSYYMKENLKDSVIHGGMTCGRFEEEEKCKDDEIPTWKNWAKGDKVEMNPWVDFNQVRKQIYLTKQFRCMISARNHISSE